MSPLACRKGLFWSQIAILFIFRQQTPLHAGFDYRFVIKTMAPLLFPLKLQAVQTWWILWFEWNSHSLLQFVRTSGRVNWFQLFTISASCWGHHLSTLTFASKLTTMEIQAVYFFHFARILVALQRLCISSVSCARILLFFAAMTVVSWIGIWMLRRQPSFHWFDW